MQWQQFKIKDFQGINSNIRNMQVNQTEELINLELRGKIGDLTKIGGYKDTVSLPEGTTIVSVQTLLVNSESKTLIVCTNAAELIIYNGYDVVGFVAIDNLKDITLHKVLNTILISFGGNSGTSIVKVFVDNTDIKIEKLDLDKVIDKVECVVGSTNPIDLGTEYIIMGVYDGFNYFRLNTFKADKNHESLKITLSTPINKRLTKVLAYKKADRVYSKCLEFDTISADGILDGSLNIYYEDIETVYSTDTATLGNKEAENVGENAILYKYNGKYNIKFKQGFKLGTKVIKEDLIYHTCNKIKPRSSFFADGSGLSFSTDIGTKFNYMNKGLTYRLIIRQMQDDGDYEYSINNKTYNIKKDFTPTRYSPGLAEFRFSDFISYDNYIGTGVDIYYKDFVGVQELSVRKRPSAHNNNHPKDKYLLISKYDTIMDAPDRSVSMNSIDIKLDDEKGTIYKLQIEACYLYPEFGEGSFIKEVDGIDFDIKLTDTSNTVVNKLKITKGTESYYLIEKGDYDIKKIEIFPGTRAKLFGEWFTGAYAAYNLKITRVEAKQKEVIEGTQLETDAGYSVAENTMYAKGWDKALISNGRTLAMNCCFADQRYENKIFYSYINKGSYMYDVISADQWIDTEDFLGDKSINFFALRNGDLLVFKRNSVLRVSLNNRKEILKNNIGLVNRNAIVQDGDIIYFAALDGIYLTDGIQIKKISEPIDDLYREVNKDKLIFAIDTVENDLKISDGEKEFIFTKRGWLKSDEAGIEAYSANLNKLYVVKNGLSLLEYSNESSGEKYVCFRSAFIDINLISQFIHTQRFIVRSVWLNGKFNGNNEQMHIKIIADGKVLITKTFAELNLTDVYNARFLPFNCAIMQIEISGYFTEFNLSSIGILWKPMTIGFLG